MLDTIFSVDIILSFTETMVAEETPENIILQGLEVLRLPHQISHYVYTYNHFKHTFCIVAFYVVVFRTPESKVVVGLHRQWISWE